LSRELISKVYEGDCLEVLRSHEADKFDLIMTSPPYADRRKKTYQGVPPEKYVEWFLPRSEQFLRTLKPTGTFILNIKESAENGQRLTYVLELILALVDQGWLWTEEFIWNKVCCYPGKWPNRFRDAWERLLQFNKTPKFKMFQDRVMIPASERTVTRAKKMRGDDYVRRTNKTQSGFGSRIANWVGRTKVYPTNVLTLPTETQNRIHSAAFPQVLPEWFITLFTDEWDWVLDPFVGVGTTLDASIKLNRHSVGIELKPSYAKIAEDHTQKSRALFFF